MCKPAISCIVTVVLTSLFTYPCWAGHIPGHQDSDPLFPVPIPEKEFFEGGSGVYRERHVYWTFETDKLNGEKVP